MFDGDHDPVVRPRVKICGLTTAADAAAAIEFGADALGFNFFAGSRRYSPIETSREWIAGLPAGIAKVAVLVNPDWAEATAVAAMAGITALQLHGTVTSETSLENLPSFSTRTIVLDSAGQGEFGGSGRVFPWKIARAFVEANLQLRVILAGGLTPENVADAVAMIRPFGVDVTSGVESSAGRKDYGRLRAFIAAARGR
jgi:phosphoribosylanthranilate isomerase